MQSEAIIPLEPQNLSSGDSLAGSRTRCPEMLRLHKPETAQHFVQFYDQDIFVIENVAYLAAKALEAGDSSVLVATPAHLTAIEERLATFAVDLHRVRAAGRYVALDASATLETFLIDGMPDKTRFDRVVGDVIRGASKRSANRFVFAFGEMVALLCAAKRPDAAVRLEQLWNALATEHRFSLYCAYPLGSFGADHDLDSFFQICSEHSLAIPAETLF